MKQCQELLADSETKGEVYLHCLGNAIKRGITLALTLVQESNNGLGYEANTSTIDLVGSLADADLSHGKCNVLIILRLFLPADDLHPLNDDEDFSIQRRKNSCLHIKVFRQSNALNRTP